MVVHPIPPVYEPDSRILILGSFPSVRSRKEMFFYGHPQNRFWKVISAVTESPVPQDIMQKKELLIKNHIALWDVIRSCDIIGSDDASIKNAEPNDLSIILDTADIRCIFTNGTKSYDMYMKYIYPEIKREAVKLHSTSPANASWSLKRLIEEWEVIKEYII